MCELLKNTVLFQKYQLNDQNFNPNTSTPVIFINIGGEGTANKKWVCWTNYTYMKLVHKYSAIAIQLEHRFFGYSYPKFTADGFGDMSTETLSLLTSQQALADLANFIQHFTYNNKPLSNAKWVAVGGSYPGSLCAWFRAQYPDLTVGGICSSAPLWAKVDFYGQLTRSYSNHLNALSIQIINLILRCVLEYAQVMEDAITDYDKTCANHIKDGFTQLRQYTYGISERDYLNVIFK